MAGKKKQILVTSALPYVNNVPHLGNIIGCVLSADVFARFCRSRGYKTLYVCGTDEHGTTTEAKALEEGLTPVEICNKYYKIHKEIYEWFGCSFDCFGRTSAAVHHKLTGEIFKRLDQNGYIKEGALDQAYCPKCEKFLADRFITGTCPHCSYKNARGDQCESCGKLLNAVELLDARCTLCNTLPEVRQSKHLFLDLAKLEPALKEWAEKRSITGFWPENARTVTDAWLKEGLKERCITRDLKWGIAVPKTGYKDKVFYVWFDAPIGYISITKGCRKDWKKWWKNSDVLLYQFMAKDNIPFHTILFPATLIGTDDSYTLLHHINSTEYLNYEAGKFSKSLGQGIFGDDAMQIGIPVDVWRYYLLVNRPEHSDTVFSWDDFQDKANNELLANLGNFINRTLMFLEKNFDCVIPKKQLNEADRSFMKLITGETDKLAALMEKVMIREGLRQLMHILKLANAYFQESEPWKTIKADKQRCSTVLNICTNLAAIAAIAAEPFLPSSSEKIFTQLNLGKKKWKDISFRLLKENHRIGKPEPLFRKLPDDEIKSYKNRFAGGRQERDEPFSKLNLKVGKIISAELHPDAEKLMVLQADLKSEKRQLVAGIRKHYTTEELVGKKIVVLTNLAPATLKGIESNGMLLAAVKSDRVVLLEAPKSDAGNQVFIRGINPKNEQIAINDFAAIKLAVKGKRVLYNNSPLCTEKEEIVVNIDDRAIVG